MAHQLWEADEATWQAASDEEWVTALFDPPPFPDPTPMGWLKRNRPQVKAKYLNLFHLGNIPETAKKLHDI